MGGVKREVTSEELERPLVPYRDAVDRILAGFETRTPERVPVSESLALVLSEDVVAGLDVPGFDNSAMDGFAIRSADTKGAKPVVLRLVDDLPAGTAPRINVESGTAATIMTGAPLPPGADAVVPWEDTERRGDEVAVLVEIAPGRHVRPAGEDVRAGDTVIPKGAILGPVHVGVIASLGITHVLAVPRPRVAVLSSGDELVPPGGKLMPGQVFDANRAVITALCEREGVRVVAEALLPDDPEAMAEWLTEAASKADLIVTTGGASVGEHDWIRAILEKEGALELWRVAIKPGKPIAFGRIAGAPVLALPGNPGSAFVGMHVFVLPALRKLAGRDPAPRAVEARLGAAVKGSPSRTLFCRVRLDGSLAHPLPAQSSVVLSNLLPTEGFAVVPPGGLAEGDGVAVELL
jgi:molybdopterin molybdotransferase